MSEITKRLFNSSLHADVQFSVQDQIIYAHSLELIKRSEVFEQQLKDKIGDVKLIPITDCKYESFHEFIRYVYTDEVTIDRNNFADILKLATTYQFVKLENQVLDSRIGSPEWCLKCFEHCVLHNYEKAWNFINIHSAANYATELKHEQFVLVHPDAVDEFLKFECVPKGVTEMQIFTYLAKWINSYCQRYEITLAEGRQRWDKLIRKIRFPTMTNEELRECYKKYPGLLSKSDLMSISRQVVFGDSDSGLWISKGRETFIPPFEYQYFHRSKEPQTTFYVTSDTILYGFRIGIEESRKPIEIEILEHEDYSSHYHQKILFLRKTLSWREVIIKEYPIQLKPKFTYKIRIKFLEMFTNLNVWCRSYGTNVIINDCCVKLIEASSNMIEMFFEPQ